MTIPELRKAFQAAADSLGGWPIVVRLREPVDAGARGCTYKAMENYAVIDVKPTGNYMQMFRTFLHEVGHVKLHFDTLQATNDAKLEPAHFEIGAAGHVSTNRKPDPREAQAWELAQAWERWAAAKTRSYLEPGSPAAVCVPVYLAALKYYPK